MTLFPWSEVKDEFRAVLAYILRSHAFLTYFIVTAVAAIVAHNLYESGVWLAVLVAVLKIAPLVPLYRWAKFRNGQIGNGVAFGMIGDVMLSPLVNAFWHGVASFGAGHLSYVCGLWQVSKSRRGWFALPLVGAAVAQLFLLWDQGWPTAVGLAVYGLLVAWMAAAAATAGWPAFLGALLFALSDGMIAVHTFVFPIPGYYALMLSTYYVGQLLIVAGGLVGRGDVGR